MILITGGTGLLGAHLIKSLIDKNYQIRAIKRKDSDLFIIKNVFSWYFNDPGIKLNSIEWVDADLLDVCSVEEQIKDINTIYNCAGFISFNRQEKKQVFDVNVNGTRNLVDVALAGKVDKICHVSSIAALGRSENNELLTEDTAWKSSKNNSVYSQAKYEGELEIWRGMEEGLQTVIVCPSVIIGTGNLSKGSTRIIKTVKDGLKFYPDGINGFVDVRDVSEIMIRLVEQNIFGEKFIINSENLSYKELFYMIAEILQSTPPSRNAGRIMGELYRVYVGLKGLATGNKPLVTKETTRTAYTKSYYSNKKILDTFTDFHFIPVQESLEHACNQIYNHQNKKKLS